MENNLDHIRLVQQAQLGDQECLTLLAEAVSERLSSYVYRCTLSTDLTEDIVQETIVKMLEVLGELKEADRFWLWLFKIALSKIFIHHRVERQRKNMHKTMANMSNAKEDKETAIANMISEELREVVFSAMYELKPKHRAIINMRCYDEMSYSDIADTLGCSKLAAQMLFYRAKKSLKKQLARNGFGKGSMLMALVLFGKLTAPNEVAAAQITVTAATMKVGTAASVGAIVASKTAIVSLAAGALTVGTMAVTTGSGGGVSEYVEKPAGSSYSNVMPQEVEAHNDNLKYLYYYPAKADSAVMMRVEAVDGKSNYRYCQSLQNAERNYYFDWHENTVHINNYRQWHDNLNVWRLPTDSSKLTAFLTQIDGRGQWAKDVYRNDDGLLVVTAPPGHESGDGIQVSRHSNILGEDYFRYDWPVGAKVVDNRDAMHKRGWTYFTVTGEIDGKEVEGAGRLPFVYAASKSHWAWMKLRVGGESYFDKRFFGLSRPWDGLHTIDTIRRDAIEREVNFETKYNKSDGKAEIVLHIKNGQIVYTVDMEADIVEKIIFTGQRQGQLTFNYLQDIDEIGSGFAEPRYNNSRQKAFSVFKASRE